MLLYANGMKFRAQEFIMQYTLTLSYYHHFSDSTYVLYTLLAI